jgi:hypothetical protein
MKKKALSRNKKPGFHTWNRGNTKITNLTRQTYFFTIYHFDVADSGSVNVDRPIKICHMSSCHVSTNSRPVRNFFSNFAYWWAVRSKLGKRGPSDQNMLRVDVPRVNIFPPNKRYEPIGDWHVACPATTWRVKYIPSIHDHINKICKKSSTKTPVLRSNILQQKQNLPISGRCFMVNLRESEVEALNPW